MNHPFIKCLNPNFVTNIYTGEKILVECGRCEACLMKKSLARTTRCKLESSVHRFTYFCTLTYRNDTVPYAELFQIDKNEELYSMVEPDGNILGEIKFYKHIDKMILLKKCKSPHNRVPYLRKRDVQLFIKRLRKYIYKLTNEKIRLFYCGEYGLLHFRPHFHLLLWFDKDETSEIIHEAISSCWTFGRVDSQLSQDKSASYVSSYLNGTAYLPRVFKFSSTAPFSNHSFYLGESVFQDIGKAIQENEFDRVAKKRVFGNGINTECILWRSFKTRILPKCKGYNDKSFESRIYSCQLYEKLREWTQETQPLAQARFVTDYVILNDFYSEFEPFNEMLQYFRLNYGYYTENQNGEQFYIMPFISDWKKFERSVYMELLFSRRFINIICNGDSSLIHCKLKTIDSFYKYLDYENLKQQLKLEQQLSKTPDCKHMKYFFHNVFDIDSFKNERFFKTYLSSRIDMYKSFAKHKEQNDKNLIFNYI